MRTVREGVGGVEYLTRFAVPGGFIYQTPNVVAGDMVGPLISAGTSVFVPNPPPLVRLAGASDDEHFINPSAVHALLVRREDDGSANGTEVYFGAQDAILHVKGTPEEVAAKLGLAVSP